MRATFNASFVCSPSKARKDGLSPIELSLSINGKRTYIQLPKKCNPEEFNKLLYSRKDNDIKTYCQTILQRINEIQTTLTVNGEPITAQRIKDYFKYGASTPSYTLEELFKEGLSIKRAEGVKYNTYKKYVNATRHFYEHTGRKGSDEVADIKNADIVIFKAKAGAVSKASTLAKEMSYIKYFFTYAFNNGKIKAHPFGTMKIKKMYEEQIYLTYDEVEDIANARITNDCLDKVRDIFLFMCGTGLEYADMEQLSKDDVKRNSYGKLYIKKKRVKTANRDEGVEYTTILFGHAPEIWDFYYGDLPLISNQKMNAYLKEVAKIAGIEKNLTTLTARHTFGTLALSHYGLPMDIVQKMMGHTNPTQTKAYAKLLDNAVFKATSEPEHKSGTPTPSALSMAEIRALEEELGIM